MKIGYRKPISGVLFAVASLLLTTSAFAGERATITDISETKYGDSNDLTKIYVTLSNKTKWRYDVSFTDEVPQAKRWDVAIRRWKVGDVIAVTKGGCGALSDLLTDMNQQAPYRDVCF
jgi:hypothetical protein